MDHAVWPGRVGGRRGKDVGRGRQILAQSINVNPLFNNDGPTSLQGLLEAHVDAGGASRVCLDTVPAAVISAWVKSRWERGRWYRRARRRGGATEHWTPAAQRTIIQNKVNDGADVRNDPVKLTADGPLLVRGTCRPLFRFFDLIFYNKSIVYSNCQYLAIIHRRSSTVRFMNLSAREFLRCTGYERLAQ